MSFNNINRASTSSVTGSSHGRINGSHLVQDQNEPRTNSIFTGSKSGEYPQGRTSRAGGLSSRGTNSNQRTHHAPASSPNLVPSQNNGASDWAEKSEPNFLDLALEESDDDSEDEWEEVTCTANNTTVDRPLIAAPSGFTVPTRGKRSEFLTLEVIEDWQPSPLPSASYTDDPQTALHEDTGCRLTQELAGEEDDLEADLQLEAELAEGLADLSTPVPGPLRQPQSCTPDAANNTTNAPPPTQLPVHLRLEVIEQPSPMRTSVKGRGKVAGHKHAERPHKPVKHTDPPRVTSVIEDPPARKPRVSFQEKAIELTRSRRRLLAPSGPLVPRNPIANLPFSTTGGVSSTPNSSHPCTQAASDSLSSLFTPKGFSHHVQTLRQRQTEDSRRRPHGWYGGVTAEHAGQDLAGSMPTATPTRPLDASKGTQPGQKHQVRRNVGGKRISKAQAQAEDVMKICRSAKSYIVDMAAIKRHEAPALPTLPSARPSSIRPEAAVPVAASERTSKARPQVPLSTPRFLPQFLSTSLGSVPQGLKFKRKPKTPPEPGEMTAETAGTGTSSYRDIHRPRLASASRDDGLLTVDMSKRRREPEGSSPRKKPRLGRS